MKSQNDARIRDVPHGHESDVLRVCYVLSYRDPQYIRTLSILEALRSCPGVELHVAVNKRRNLLRYGETWRALHKIHKHGKMDVYVLGFRGLEMFWPVRWSTRATPLIFDALMSPYGALHGERKNGFIGQMISPLVYWLERGILHNADMVLTDTRQHVEYYVRTFNLPADRLMDLPVGAVETKQPTIKDAPRLPNMHQAEFNILFYGSFLPLHGIEIILDAAALLVDLPVRFNFIGGSDRRAKRLRLRCERSGVVRYTHRRWMPFQELLEVAIPEADLCLGGPFGGTPQARRVITGKTSQCLAAGKATVVGRIDEDHGFEDRINCLLVDQNDAVALAAAIRWAFENRASLDELGKQGRELYDTRLSTRTITEKLITAIRQLVISTARSIES